MALHKDFPESPYVILDPAIRWFPADEALRESSMNKLMPPLVPQPRRKEQAIDPQLIEQAFGDGVKVSFLLQQYPE